MVAGGAVMAGAWASSLGGGGGLGLRRLGGGGLVGQQFLHRALSLADQGGDIHFGRGDPGRAAGPGPDRKVEVGQAGTEGGSAVAGGADVELANGLRRISNTSRTASSPASVVRVMDQDR